MKPERVFRRLALIVWAVSVAWGAAPVQAQQSPLRVAHGGAAPTAVQTFQHRGHVVVSISTLESLGWRVLARGPEWRLRLEPGPELLLSEETPFFRLGESRLQLVAAPYAMGSELYVPVQLLWDVFPTILPDRFATDDQGTLRVLAAAAAAATPSARPTTTSAAAQKLVVVIDPGHGGDDPGAIGPSGVREKDVALAIAVALAGELAKRPELEVHLTRDRDVLVPLWERGDRATEIKGDRTGIFISLHANALPRRREVSGFETYFLSEARTDDERRVAANENAPLAMPRDATQGTDPDLQFILRELRNLDHQHWSALLAQLVQTDLDPVHPGNNRGVKQGPFAVITNALMPAVLIEVGFITNRDEERLLASPDFHASVARSVSDAIGKFFERYPSGRDAAPGERR